MLVIADELKLLPALEVVKWWILNDYFTHTYTEPLQLLAQAMANISNLREIQLPRIYSPPIGLLDVINQNLSTISIMPQDSFSAWFQWLERHRHGLRELNITVRLFCFIFFIMY